LFHLGIPAMRGGPPIERCGTELLSALLPEGQMRKSPVFRYFPRSWAGYEESRERQTEFAGRYTRQRNRGRSVDEPGQIIGALSTPDQSTYKHAIYLRCSTMNTRMLFNFMKLLCLYYVNLLP
jgi:hypothetical protein